MPPFSKAAKDLALAFQAVRERTIELCKPLKTEDYVVQPVVDVSPPKWHLGHTTWFFERFVLKPNIKGYREYDPNYNFVFNSYYETVGARIIRTDRGNLSRPTVNEIFGYRQHVDRHMRTLLNGDLEEAVRKVIVLGLNHEQQHQELLLTDIKYILGHNPLFPVYSDIVVDDRPEKTKREWLQVQEGLYPIGYSGNGFCYDNELGSHQVFLPEFEIASNLVTNAEYQEFMDDGGYDDFRHWHSEGWDWAKQLRTKAPMYWHPIDGAWHNYTLNGLHAVNAEAPVTHVNYYEASAYATWKKMRLPTEFEWEAASPKLKWGWRWEWTNSAYLAYPGYKKEEGALGEYNGKFMVNQMVLRGASVVTPDGHSRHTYRNFFHPNLQWQFNGIRLVR